MALQELYLVEAEHLLDDHRVGVGGARRLDLLLAQSEDVLQTVQRNLKQEYSTLTLSDIKSHLHNLAVHDGEQVTERRYAALLHKELDLLSGATRARVRDRPRRLLPGLELGFRLREVEESLGSVTKSINITWMSISTGKILASITAWICWRFPAVMFEMVQHA